MAKIKKRNKKHNLANSKVVAARTVLRNLALFHSQNAEGENTAEVINVYTHKKQHVGPTISAAFNDYRYYWEILVLAICEDSDGKRYIKEGITDTTVINKDKKIVKAPLFQHEIAGSALDASKRFIDKEVNKQHIKNVAWLACPIAGQLKKLSTGSIEDLITTKGAW